MYGELLAIDLPGINDDFFADLGGHSLLATRLVSLLRDTFQADIALQKVFEATSVSSLARSLIEDAETRLHFGKVTSLLSELSKAPDSEVDMMLASLSGAVTTVSPSPRPS